MNWRRACHRHEPGCQYRLGAFAAATHLSLRTQNGFDIDQLAGDVMSAAGYCSREHHASWDCPFQEAVATALQNKQDQRDAASCQCLVIVRHA